MPNAKWLIVSGLARRLKTALRSYCGMPICARARAMSSAVIFPEESFAVCVPGAMLLRAPACRLRGRFPGSGSLSNMIILRRTFRPCALCGGRALPPLSTGGLCHLPQLELEHLAQGIGGQLG